VTVFCQNLRPSRATVTEISHHATLGTGQLVIRPPEYGRGRGWFYEADTDLAMPITKQGLSHKLGSAPFFF